MPDTTIVHNCQQVLDVVTGSRPDLRDQAYEKADLTLYTDGSSFIKDGQRYARAAVTTEDKVLWQRALPAGTSAQRAELTGLTRALQIAEGKVVNIYTDSRYAFVTAHIHGATYKERGLLAAGGKDIKNRSEILALLEAIWLPTKVAIIHCKGHQKEDSPIIRVLTGSATHPERGARPPGGSPIQTGELCSAPRITRTRTVGVDSQPPRELRAPMDRTLPGTAKHPIGCASG